jgi:regulator of cell morphogenesis and NO signaling
MMTTLDVLDTSLGQLVSERPSRAAFFERMGLDYCCGGGRSLRTACALRGLEPDTLLRELAEWDGRTGEVSGPDWSTAELSALCDHIETVHHGYLRTVLPELALMLEKVLHAHGAAHPELAELRQVFASFWGELYCHMQKEEKIVFPMCRALAEGSTPEGPLLRSGTVHSPIAVMVQEHEAAGDELGAMRRLTRDYSPPEGACATYRGLLAGLAELEADMHLHIHKENNILFPRAMEVEERQNPERPMEPFASCGSN